MLKLALFVLSLGLDTFAVATRRSDYAASPHRRLLLTENLT